MPLIKANIQHLVFDVAANTKDRILGIYTQKTGNALDIINNFDALPFDDDFISKAKKPCEHTLLHKYIENYLHAEYEYTAKRHEEHFPPIAYSILDAYNIEYKKIEFIDRNSNYHLLEKIIPAFRPLAHDVFCILFYDRSLMRQFSRIVASINAQNFQRVTYWPQWLKKALINRDHGRCGICSCDLTGIIAIDQEIHIDHMIPISQKGTNDPTNLQILCSECNLKKGNRSDETSPVHHVPWQLK